MDDSAGLSVAQRQFRRRPSAYLMAPRPADQKFLGFMISAAGVTRSDRVLDVACGSGSATLAFAERCAGTVGIDVLDEPLRRARDEAAERKINNAAFTLSEMERLAFADGAFTGAICRFSFHHFVNPQKVFAEMARVVASGGWIMISDMTAPEDPDQAELHNQMERLCDPSHARALPASEFERMFARQGLDLTYKQTVKSTYSLEDWIAHGAPTPDRAARILEMMEASANEDARARPSASPIPASAL